MCQALLKVLERRQGAKSTCLHGVYILIRGGVVSNHKHYNIVSFCRKCCDKDITKA